MSEGRTKSQTKELTVTNPPAAPPPPIKWNHIPTKDGDFIMMGCDVAVGTDNSVTITGKVTKKGVEILKLMSK